MNLTEWPLALWKTEIQVQLDQIKSEVDRFIEWYPGNNRHWALTFQEDDNEQNVSELQEGRSVMFKGDKRIVLESSYNTFHYRMRDTALYNLYLSFMKVNPLGRVRILRLNRGDKYRLHADHEMRFHLALDTNPHCFLMVQSGPGRCLERPDPTPLDLQMDMTSQFGIYHIPADGYLYGLNASRGHTAMNLGDTPRTHIVFNEISEINNVYG